MTRTNPHRQLVDMARLHLQDLMELILIADKIEDLDLPTILRRWLSKHPLLEEAQTMLANTLNARPAFMNELKDYLEIT